MWKDELLSGSNFYFPFRSCLDPYVEKLVQDVAFVLKLMLRDVYVEFHCL